MSNKVEILTNYIPQLKDNQIGNWVGDCDNDGTIEHPYRMPFVNYSELIEKFINDVYTFVDGNKDMELTNYGGILEKNNLKWDMEIMKQANASLLEPQCVMALILGAVRAERFCHERF